jgi:hypothetical protein
MRKFCRLVLFLAVPFAFLAGALPAPAHDYKKGPLHIDHPWSRATPQGATVAAGYLVIENRGAEAERLITVSVPAEFAGRAEIHEMAVVDGVMRMRPLPRGIEIAPGMTAKFEPGGLHFMFVDIKRPLTRGDRFKSTLVFERAGTIEVEFAVEAMGSGGHHLGH